MKTTRCPSDFGHPIQDTRQVEIGNSDHGGHKTVLHLIGVVVDEVVSGAPLHPDASVSSLVRGLVRTVV